MMVDITETVDIGLYPEIRCFSCKSLLAVSPILLNAEGKNLCGRCLKDSDDRPFLRNVHYERLAVQFKFPCRYFTEGCYVKKRFNEIKAHEVECPYQIIKCPVKKCTWSGITTELIIHFDLNHEELKVNNNDVKKLSAMDECFMLITNDFHFVINWIRHDKISCIVEVKSLNFIDPRSDINIVCTIATSNFENLLKISQAIKLNTSTVINLHEFHKILSITVDLPTNVINNRSEQLNKIKCPCCLLQMAPPILKCPSNHITCLDCTRADYDFCGLCVEDDLHFSRQYDLELITVSSLYMCKWEGCGRNFSYKQIRTHEQSCSKRTFMCMHCFQWYGFFSEICPHDAVCPSKKSLCPLITDNEVTILGINTVMGEYLLLAFNEIFWINCKPTESGTNISVSNYGPVSSLDWYCYEADLQHLKDSNSPFNKTFSIKNKAYNEFTVDVPCDDIAKFGESKCYKITVRIILLGIDERNKNMNINFRRFS